MSETDPYAAPDAPAVEEAKGITPVAVDSFDQTVAETPVEAPQAEEATVPEGSIKAVLGWVGDDATKAQKALDAEAAGDQRSTLISKLEALIN